MNYRYQPYPYARRYYNIDPYHYGRYYNPYYNYQQNIIDSQIANVDQSIVNYGDMTDVIQDSYIYQSMAPAPENKEVTQIETIKTNLAVPPVINSESGDGQEPPQITISC